MSLVNDALRRADMEQRQREAGVEVPAAPPLPPGDDPPEPPGPRRRRSTWTVLLGVTLLVLAGLLAYGVWWSVGTAREETGLAVRSATAAAGEGGRKGSHPPAAGKAADAETAKAEASGQADGSASARTRAAASNETAEAAPHETPATDDGPPDARPAGMVASAEVPDLSVPAAGDPAAEWTPDLRLRAATDGASDEATGSDAAIPALYERMLAVIRSAARDAVRREMPATVRRPTARSPGHPRQAAPFGSGAPDAAAGAEMPAPSGTGRGAAAKTETVRPAPVDTSPFKVSSIMTGPRGGLAVINGRPVREGDTVAGATVLTITSRWVELEVDGRRATVGM